MTIADATCGRCRDYLRDCICEYCPNCGQLCSPEVGYCDDCYADLEE